MRMGAHGNCRHMPLHPAKTMKTSVTLFVILAVKIVDINLASGNLPESP